MRPTWVYVAASSLEIERAERVMSALRDGGCVVAHDWCSRMRALGPESALSADELADELRSCLDGVAAADVVLLLAPTAPTVGAWVELGYAAGLYVGRLGLCPLIAASGAVLPPWAYTIGAMHFAADDDAVRMCLEVIR